MSFYLALFPPKNFKQTKSCEVQEIFFLLAALLRMSKAPTNRNDFSNLTTMTLTFCSEKTNRYGWWRMRGRRLNVNAKILDPKTVCSILKM